MENGQIYYPSISSLEFVIASVFFFSFPFFLCVWGDARSNLSTRMVLRKETHHLSFAFRIHVFYCMHTNSILSFCHSLKQDWCPNMPEKKD